ncbi:PAAR domain-containing protein [Avibacterium sp. 21-599]|uniref:PAAR domain-containing protein n=1 Tax=Avibacterium sp. 21-599 TaxID=2911528 RepID=UPI0022482DB0|nr:PAAR domain-containing protein [Avibacterium sp. 21-599]MCW9719125.1 PAAR domain-containing protein [Avibacterium sp. 21-599]
MQHSKSTSSPQRWSITPKGKNPAHIGASVLHPDGSVGQVVGGQSTVTFGGKAAACIGDKVECPGHSGVIIAGAKTVSIGGKALAREGDKTSCGGVIINAFPTITVYDSTKTVHGKSIAGVKEIRLNLMESAHSKQSAYAGMPYKVMIEQQEIGQGVIDETGSLYFEVKDTDKEGEIELGNGQRFHLQLIEEIDLASTLDKQGYPTEQAQDNELADYHQVLKDN